METIIVLVWMAHVGGQAQLLAVEQGNQQECEERAKEMRAATQVLGPEINGQQTYIDIVDGKAWCVNMTEAELFSFADQT